MSYITDLSDLTILADESTTDHNLLQNFVANEHIDWTSATQNLSTSGTVVGSNISGSNTGDQNLFSTFTADVGAALTPATLTSTINFVGGTNMTITSNGVDTLTFDAATGGSGEANTASNQGGHNELFIQKTGVDLEFRTVTSGDTSISFTQNPQDLDIQVNEAAVDHDSLLNFVANEHIDWTSATQNISTTGTISGSNLSGTNTGDQFLFSTIAVSGQSDVVADNTTDTLTLIAGTNITLTTDPIGDSVTIDASGGGGGEANTTSNQGGFVEFALPKVGVDLPFRTLQSSDSSITVTQNASDVDITANEANIDHDSLLNFVANEHIDWTSATQNLVTTGTIDSANYDVTGSVAAGSINSGTNTGDQNLWETITADLGAALTPNIATDTLNFVGGTNITITSDGVDTLTIDSTGGGGGVSLQNIDVFTASGTWNRPVGITQVLVKVIGGGGGGGGAEASAGGGGTRVASAGGGAAAGYSEELIDVSGTPSVSVTVGAGGTGGTATGGADGGIGGTSSFGAFCSATGGSGGIGTGAGAADGTSTAGGATAGTGIGGDVNFTGSTGTSGRSTVGSNAGGGNGAGAPSGMGGGRGGFVNSVTTTAPSAGTNGG
jgi:hypothetical protein